MKPFNIAQGAAVVIIIIFYYYLEFFKFKK